MSWPPWIHASPVFIALLYILKPPPSKDDDIEAQRSTLLPTGTEVAKAGQPDLTESA